MNLNPEIIDRVEIKYFRSIHTAIINKPSSLAVITGSNDTGKSNLLKALDLFFNYPNNLSWDFDFSKDFNHHRLNEVRKESIKGKQFIQVKITFNRGKNYINSLPEKFTVTKNWLRNGEEKTSDNLEKYINKGVLKTTKGRAQASLSGFLGKINFIYIPAIKDRTTFSKVLQDLQTNLTESLVSKVLKGEIENINTELLKKINDLQQDFYQSTGITAYLGLPTQDKDLFQSLKVNTAGIDDSSEYHIPLDHRGDGMRVRFIPAILDYISQKNTKKHYIWGLEEPENSMEFKRAFELFEKMKNHYSRHAQIFVTSHSPAFVDIKGEKPNIYHVKNVDGQTNATKIDKEKSLRLFDEDPEIAIAEDLGHISFLSNLREKMQQKINHAEELNRISEQAIQSLQEMEKPTLFTEGKTDVSILHEAWKRLYPSQNLTYDIKSCDIYHDTDKNTASGAGMLKNFLQTVRHDSPYTVIGMFDRDGEGINKGFKLNNNFNAIEGLSDTKVSKNSKAYAFLLPTPEGKEKFAEVQNLIIEFYFDENTLNDNNLLKPQKIIKRNNYGIEVGTEDANEPHLVEFIGDKKNFSDEIIPTLPDSAFENFKLIFEHIDKILSHPENDE